MAMVLGQIKEPFTISTLLPRRNIPLSETPLRVCDIGGSILVVESNDGADFLDFFGNLVCWNLEILVCIKWELQYSRPQEVRMLWEDKMTAVPQKYWTVVWREEVRTLILKELRIGLK